MQNESFLPCWLNTGLSSAIAYFPNIQPIQGKRLVQLIHQYMNGSEVKWSKSKIRLFSVYVILRKLNI